MITSIFCTKCGSILYFLVLLLLVCLTSSAGFPCYPIANVSTSWNINHPFDFINFDDGSRVRVILLSGNSGPQFACGFFCKGLYCSTYLFAIFFFEIDNSLIQSSDSRQVVWSANRNRPVASNATLQLKMDGGLVLQDADGSIVWSPHTRVAGLNLTDGDNLVVFNDNGATVWQSFDHPTDCLLPSQKFTVGQKLTASVSPTNWSESSLSLSVTDRRLIVSAGSNPLQVYFEFASEQLEFTFLNGSIHFLSRASVDSNHQKIHVPASSSVQCMRFGFDGNLRIYEWRKLILGCHATVPLSCEASEYHSFLEITNATFFAFQADYENIFSLTDTRNVFAPCGRTVYVKVQNGSTADAQRKKSGRKKGNDEEAEEDYIDQVPGMTTRFSYEDLKAMTENFTKLLGKGGFGSVFEGTLADGTKIAVNQLHGSG
ncbi:hypothetical protein NC652_022051 [Populus alba x Populus x berolinensis]|nr:hypothetical protein NC652_022051 [Populus alba x Populus x berolinensis]